MNVLEQKRRDVDKYAGDVFYSSRYSGKSPSRLLPPPFPPLVHVEPPRARLASARAGGASWGAAH